MTTNYDSWIDRDLPDDDSDDEHEDAVARLVVIEERMAELVDWIACSRHEINVALQNGDLVLEADSRGALEDDLAEYATLEREHSALCNEYGFY